MSERILDVRGKTCPVPVVETRKALLADAAAPLRVLVDNRAAVENVRRFAQSLGRRVETEEVSATEFHILIAGAGAPAVPASAPAAPAPAPHPPTAAASDVKGIGTVVLFSSDEFGHGARELGELLVRTFVYTLKEVEPAPHALLFVNSGVRLTTEGSALLEDLCELAGRGVQVFSCGTCLDYYGLKEKLKVGAVTNMFSIVSLLSTADRVIRP
jgi:selenium metabolism protein YedF